jgi:hypothetical protein
MESSTVIPDLSQCSEYINKTLIHVVKGLQYYPKDDLPDPEAYEG